MIHPSLNVLQLAEYPIFKQLQLEEALLRADTQNWCLINIGTPTSIVMGISGDPNHLINPIRYKKDPIPLIRRFSGGGTVITDKNTIFVTFIFNKHDIALPSYPEHILKWSEQIYQKVIPNSRLIENDYVIGDKKFGGNAQYFRKDRWLHHSSLLWDYTPQNMEYLLLPPKRPKYRSDRSHTDFLHCLRHVSESKNFLINQLLEQLRTAFTLKNTELGKAELALNEPHRKSTSLVHW